MPDVVDLKLFILNEMHKPLYAGQPGYKNMITTLRKQLFWPRLRADVIDYLSKCLESQQVKVKHHHPRGLLHPLPILEWKWEVISLDFITGFLRTQRQHDSIMVVVDKLSKYAHFIPVRSTYKVDNIVEIFLKEIFRLHGAPKMVISDWDVKFMSYFWKSFFAVLETKINFNTSYHPETDGQT